MDHVDILIVVILNLIFVVAVDNVVIVDAVAIYCVAAIVFERRASV